MKKKLLSAALVIALIAIMVGSSLAYFTDADQVTNTFTVGSVLIDIWENGEATDSDTVVVDNPLLPVVNTDNVAQDPGYAAKVVKVENTGKNNAYVRVHIAIPTKLVGYLYLDLNDSGWVRQADSAATKDDVQYTVFTYDYNSAVAPDAFTTELLKGAYLNSNVDIKDNPATPSADLEFCTPNADGTYTFSGFAAHSAVTGGYTSNKVNILVAAQAIQVQGFEGVTATEALNTGFGTGNPWQ